MPMKTILELEEREPYFNGWETDGANYTFSCQSCKSEHEVVFDEILKAAWGWSSNMEQERTKAIAKHFRINLNNKSIQHGMDAIVPYKCESCGIDYLAYFWLDEYLHSCYELSLYGLSQEYT